MLLSAVCVLVVELSSSKIPEGLMNNPVYLGCFFLDPEDIRKLSIGAIWNFAKGTGLL